LVNKLRELGYVFVERTKRTELYRKKGGTERIPLTTHASFAEVYVILILRQCGLSKEQIQAFLHSAQD
jgi:hypothetical protein